MNLHNQPAYPSVHAVKTSPGNKTLQLTNNMKTKCLFLLMAVIVGLVTPPAHAIYYWQPNGWDGTGDVPSGTWSTTDPNWNDGSKDYQVFAAPATLQPKVVFCYTGASVPANAYTVTVAPGENFIVPSFLCAAGHPTVVGDTLRLRSDANGPALVEVYTNLTFTLNCGLTNFSAAPNGLCLNKIGPGTLVLGAVNQLLNGSGDPAGVRIDGGRLRLSVTQAFGRTNHLVLGASDTGDPAASAIFDTGGLDQQLGTLNLAGPSTDTARTLDLGDGTGTLTFADSSAQPWLSIDQEDIFLHITNYRPGVNALRFGTSASGLTTRQLQLIRFSEFDNAVGQIDAQGFITPGAVPPAIVSHPKNTNAIAGATVSFSAVATGENLSYQWRKDGVDIAVEDNPTANAATLVLNNVQPPDAARYSVVVANAAVQVVSRAGRLIVYRADPMVLHQGLVSYWPLDTANGTTPDLSFGNDLTVDGSVSPVAGKLGNTLAFGSGAYLHVGPTDFANTGLPNWHAGEYSIAFWIKVPANKVNKYAFSEASLSDNYSLFFFEPSSSGGKLQVYLRDRANKVLINKIPTAAVVCDDTWHHVTFVDRRGRVEVYVDGVLDSQSSSGKFDYAYNPDAIQFNTVAIGGLYRSTSSGVPFPGLLDEVAVWERPLSAAEVEVLVASGIPTPIAPRAPGIASISPDATVYPGDLHRVTVRAMNNRPFTYTWRVNDVVDPSATDATYLYPVGPSDSDLTIAVEVSNPYGTVSATNHVTVIGDPPPALDNGMVNYWPLDTIEVHPGTGDFYAPDAAGGKDLVLMGFGGVGDLVPGMRGNALWFDAVRYGYRAGGAPLSLRSNYSIALWVNLPPGGYNQADTALYAEASTANANTLFSITAGVEPALRVTIRSDAGTTLLSKDSTLPAIDGNWHYVVWTDTNGQGRLYIDGQVDPTDFSYTRAPLTPDTTAVGAVLRAEPSFALLYGYLDDIATWDRALTGAEVQEAWTTGIPTPQPAAPTILVEPQDVNVYEGDAAMLSVWADGYFPLSYQWYKDGEALSGAVDSTLAFSNLQGSDTGGYTVAITNLSGAITSRVAQVTVNPYALATTGVVLKVDFGIVGATPSPVADGFVMGGDGFTSVYDGGVRAWISPIGGGALAPRNRTAVVNHPPALNLAALYNDFIFDSSGGMEGQGIRISIDHLAPNTRFGVTIWSFDSLTTQDRFSAWLETSGEPVTLADPYIMRNSLPASDNEKTIRGIVTSTPAGTLQIDGLGRGYAGGAGNAVFLNGIQLEANPPASIGNVQQAGGYFSFDVSSDFPHTLQQTANLVEGPWVPVPPGGAVATNGTTVTYQFPILPGQNQLFYRAQ